MVLLDTTVLDRLEGEVGSDAVGFLIESLRKEVLEGGPEMERLISIGDIEQLQTLAHGIKSAARTFGALELGDTCEALESAAQGKQSSADLAALIARFRELSESTLAAIDQSRNG